MCIRTHKAILSNQQSKGVGMGESKVASMVQQMGRVKTAEVDSKGCKTDSKGCVEVDSMGCKTGSTYLTKAERVEFYGLCKLHTNQDGEYTDKTGLTIGQQERFSVLVKKYGFSNNND